MQQLRLCVFSFVIAAVAVPGLAVLPIPENPLWEPIVDEVYLQDVGSLIERESPLNTVAVCAGIAFVGDESGVWSLNGEKLEKQTGPTGAVTRLEVFDDTLWAVAADGLWKYREGVWSKVTGKPVADICLHDATVIIASGTELLALEEGGLTALATGGSTNVLGVASYGGTLYVHDGKQVGLLERGRIAYRNIADWGTLQRGCVVRDILSHGSRLYVATDEGLGVLRGMSWYQILGKDGLCYEDTTCLAVGFERDLWIGTMRGAVRSVNGEYQFYGRERWIPNDKVNAIACGENVVYIATDGGLGIITYEPYTLAKKAAFYERWLEEWGMKRLGFIHALFLEDGRWLREVSDNDVGYSSHYLHAKCFEYAVTGNPDVRAEAVDMMKSVKWSEEITSIEGFPARSIYAVGETTLKAQHGSGGLPAEWHATPDGVWEWKGDTSSDELVAQVYEMMVFLELVADENEREWVMEHLRRVIGHVVENDWVLRDVDGKPTRWARWDPAFLMTPYGIGERGLNALQALGFIAAATHFTHDPKFEAGKQQLIEFRYPRVILRQKLTSPPGRFTHFDDRLAFYGYYPFLHYETDPQLRALGLRSLERSWEVKRIEAVPWFNFIYGVLTGNDCETDRAVTHLRQWPLDLRRHSYTNSHREDLYPPRGYRMYSERPKPLSPRETEPNRWDGDFMRLDGTYGGRVVADPSGWLDAYWMGRYYGLITAPQAKDKKLTTVPKRGLQLGAEPYGGPARPQLWHEQ